MWKLIFLLLNDVYNALQIVGFKITKLFRTHEAQMFTLNEQELAESNCAETNTLLLSQQTVMHAPLT